LASLLGFRKKTGRILWPASAKAGGVPDDREGGRRTTTNGPHSKNPPRKKQDEARRGRAGGGSPPRRRARGAEAPRSPASRGRGGPARRPRRAAAGAGRAARRDGIPPRGSVQQAGSGPRSGHGRHERQPTGNRERG